MPLQEAQTGSTLERDADSQALPHDGLCAVIARPETELCTTTASRRQSAQSMGRSGRCAWGIDAGVGDGVSAPSGRVGQISANGQQQAGVDYLPLATCGPEGTRSALRDVGHPTAEDCPQSPDRMDSGRNASDSSPDRNRLAEDSVSRHLRDRMPAERCTSIEVGKLDAADANASASSGNSEDAIRTVRSCDGFDGCKTRSDACGVSDSVDISVSERSPSAVARTPSGLQGGGAATYSSRPLSEDSPDNGHSDGGEIIYRNGIAATRPFLSGDNDRCLHRSAIADDAGRIGNLAESDLITTSILAAGIVAVLVDLMSAAIVF